MTFEDEKIPEATGDDPIAENYAGVQDHLRKALDATADAPVTFLRDDTMKEVFYEPCGQCGAEMLQPLRLFPNEPIPLYINCFHCHSGMGKGPEEQAAYGLGMRAKPQVQETEPVLAAGT